jgi:ribonucleoside-triphosphate reductase
MYPNFVNIDVPGNIEYYQEGKPETEMATMGCRTKTLAMPDGTGRVTNRGNIAFTTINLPRLGILAEHKIDKFFGLLDQRITDCIDELLERVNYIKTKKVYNFPFLMGQNIYLGSENLGWNDSIEPALRNGTLAVGFIGIAEALKALIGKHHGESREAYQLALKIVKRIRERTDKATSETGWMFGCFATPAEGLAERFAKIDQKKFGIIEGVTDRKFYTNSFHIPVYFPITATKKMQKEGPFHALCNAGAITYVEMDGDPSKNLKAVMKLVQFSRKCGISYFSINHSVDRCPVCGYEGIIETDVCPHCGWKEGEEISLEELEKKGIDTKKLR